VHFQQRTLCPLTHLPSYKHHPWLIQALLQPPLHLPLHTHLKQPISALLSLPFHLPHHWPLYMHQLHTFQPQQQCHTFLNINAVAQKGVWRSSQCYMACIENSDSLLELGISRGWGSCWVRMQLKQQRDQGDDPGNRFHHLFLSNSEKWYVSHLYITFHLLTYSQLVSGAPSQDKGPPVQAPWVLLHGPGSSVPPTWSLLSNGNVLLLSSQATTAASRTVIHPPDVLPSTHKPDLHLLESHCTIIPDEDPQWDVETPNHTGEDGDGLEEELGEEDDPQDDNDEADNDLDEPVWKCALFHSRHSLSSFVFHALWFFFVF